MALSVFINGIKYRGIDYFFQNYEIQLVENSGSVYFVYWNNSIIKHTFILLGLDKKSGKLVFAHHNKGFKRPKVDFLEDIALGRQVFTYQNYSNPYIKAEAVERAFDLIGRGTDYSLLNNCHHFTSEACYGVRFCENLNDLKVLGTAGVTLFAINRAS